VDQQQAYKVMCSDLCVESDVMHVSAMDYSGCSCLDLSTKPNQQSYSAPGDWCMQNTARQQVPTLYIHLHQHSALICFLYKL
jgi:hypothetical protein